MDKATAQALINAVLSLDGPIGEIDTVISGMTIPEEKKAWIPRLGELLRLQNEAFVRPIVHEFPELDRDLS
jgi:hypothetical protein